MIRDVVKTPNILDKQEHTSSVLTTTNSAAIVNTISMPSDETTSSLVDGLFFSTTEVSEDVDVMIQARELCVAWNDFGHEDEMTVEIGVGTEPGQDTAIRFTAVHNTGLACVNSSTLPAYTKLFSVVRANNSAGTASFSSDGFVMVPETDPDNRLQTFTGHECTANDVIGYTVIEPPDSVIDLSLIADISVHRGDALFVQFTPFVPTVTFSGATVLTTTMSGYQVIAKSPHITFTMPPGKNTTVRIMNCFRGEPLQPGFRDDVASTWEIAGPWDNYIKYFEVELLDHTCMELPHTKEVNKSQQCLVAERHVTSRKRTANFGGLHLYNGHSYFTAVSACFDDACLPAATSDLVEYSTDLKTVNYGKAEITAESFSYLGVEVKASVTPSTDTAKSQRCVFMWTVTRDRLGSTPLTDWRTGESTSCSTIEVRGTYTLT